MSIYLFQTVKKWKATLGKWAKQLIWRGPLERPQLYGIVSGAVASVLPSRVDNLPNTVIESLQYRVPVIGSRGASIDEMVEEGRNGILVPIEDVDALAEAMVRVWRGEFAWSQNEGEQPCDNEQHDICFSHRHVVGTHGQAKHQHC